MLKCCFNKININIINIYAELGTILKKYIIDTITIT